MILDKGADPSNYNTVLNNLKRFESGEKGPPPAESEAMRVVIDSLVIEDVGVRLANMPGIGAVAGDVAVRVPRIELQNVGKEFVADVRIVDDQVGGDQHAARAMHPGDHIAIGIEVQAGDFDVGLLGQGHYLRRRLHPHNGKLYVGEAGAHVAELARMLGIGRKALWMRRRQWGLKRARKTGP